MQMPGLIDFVRGADGLTCRGHQEEKPFVFENHPLRKVAIPAILIGKPLDKGILHWVFAIDGEGKQLLIEFGMSWSHGHLLGKGG
jgi:hypothetical protein